MTTLTRPEKREFFVYTIKLFIFICMIKVLFIDFLLGSLPSVSFKLHKLHSETAGPNRLIFVKVTLL